jgi:hypothetical protein
MRCFPLALLLIGLFTFAGQGCRVHAQPPADPEALGTLHDDFAAKTLNPGRWRVTRKNDFQESKVDVVNGRLRMRAATIGTDDKTVKFHGVRTARPLSLRQPFVLSFELDWNNQANGCYLTAGVFLCPTATDGNPADEKDWWKLEYVGVPPGKNARAWVSARSRGGERVLYDEGWPAKQKTGRRIGKQAVTIRWRSDKLTVVENGKTLWQTDWKGFGFPTAHLYLQMSSHSNYPAREVFFDEVTVRSR